MCGITAAGWLFISAREENNAVAGTTGQAQRFWNGRDNRSFGEYHYDRLCPGGKRFQYPDAFSRFLTLKDAGKQNEIRAGYERRLRAERAERQKELERQERLGKIRSMKVTPYSQAAFDIPWKEAKAAAEADAVSTGFYLSGYSKDRPRIPSRLKPNSACLLTTLETGCEEKERRILGAFMVRDDFWGAYCREGMIRAHDRYKLYLPSGSMLPYWNYFEQEEFVPRWGKVVFKYFSSRVMQRILLDMCGVMDGTDQGETAAEFCDYFCAINRLSAEQAQTKATADE